MLTSWECDTLDSSNNRGKQNSKASPSFSLPVRVYLLSGEVKPTLLGAGGFTQSTFSGEVAYRGEGGVTSVFEGDRGSKQPITSSELEEFEGEIHITREPLGELHKLSGYRELEIGDSSLSVVLDSLVPNY